MGFAHAASGRFKICEDTWSQNIRTKIMPKTQVHIHENNVMLRIGCCKTMTLTRDEAIDLLHNLQRELDRAGRPQSSPIREEDQWPRRDPDYQEYET